jgi:hypothetical protein
MNRYLGSRGPAAGLWAVELPILLGGLVSCKLVSFAFAGALALPCSYVRREPEAELYFCKRELLLLLLLLLLLSPDEDERYPGRQLRSPPSAVGEIRSPPETRLPAPSSSLPLLTCLPACLTPCITFDSARVTTQPAACDTRHDVLHVAATWRDYMTLALSLRYTLAVCLSACSLISPPPFSPGSWFMVLGSCAL